LEQPALPVPKIPELVMSPIRETSFSAEKQADTEAKPENDNDFRGAFDLNESEI
jgi:hypothetical protein